MANDAATLGSAIFSAIGTAGTAQSCNLYYAMAPQPTVQAPYAIFQRQDTFDDYWFDGREISSDYIVKAISSQIYPTEARRLYELFDDALQDANLSISGYQLMRCRRTTQIEYRDTDGYWHVGALFRIDAVKT